MHCASHRSGDAAIPARAPDKQPAKPSFDRGGITACHAACRRCGAHVPPRYRPARCPRAPMRYSPVPRMPPEARRPPALRFPPSVFPLLETPFPDSPFSSGLHQRGQTAGGNARRPFWKTAQGRQRVGGFSKAPFSATALRVATTPPPLVNPSRWAPLKGSALGRAETGSRSGLPRLSALQGRRVRGVDLATQDVARRVSLAPATRRASDPATGTPVPMRHRDCHADCEPPEEDADNFSVE